MKYYNLALVFVCFIACLALNGCSKEHPKKEDYKLSFSAKALSYVQLQVGKYLIYEDSATLQLDSVVVTESKIEEFYSPDIPLTWDYGTWFNDPAFYGQQFSLVLTKYDGVSQTEWLQGSAATSFPSFVPYKSSDTIALSLYGHDADTTSALFYLSENMPTDQSLIVEGISYHNVAVTSISNLYDAGSPYYENRTYYWAKGIGLIRSRSITPGNVKTYNLLRHN